MEDLRFLAIQSGKSLLSLTPPLSRDEALLILEDIDTDTLSPAGEAAYNRVMEALNPKPFYSHGFFSVEAHIQAGVEARIRTNPAVPWTQPAQNSPSLLALPINFYFADKVQLFIEPSVTKRPQFYESNDAGSERVNFGTNIPYTVEQAAVDMPLRAFVAAGGAWWNFEMGRDRLSYGLGRSGNMAVSDTPDYYDMARLSLFSPVFKYSLLVTQMPFTINNRDQDDTIQPDEGDITHTTQRYLYVHRLDFRLFGRVSLGLTEGVMVGNSPLELRFLNPLALFHSFSSWEDYDHWGNSEDSDMAGSLFSLDVTWALFPSLALYGQFVMNEIAVPPEDGQEPNATGFMLGLEYARDLFGWAASFYAEFMYSDPYLYTLSSPFASFIWMRRTGDAGPKLWYNWIGHPEGRDTILYFAGSSVSKGNCGFSLNIAFVQKGEHTLLWDWNRGKGYNDQKTPSGVPENRLRVTLGANWKPLGSRIPQIELSVQAGETLLFNKDHVYDKRAHGFDVTTAVTCRY